MTIEKILQECKLQLQYLNEKFGETGTSNALISKIDLFVNKLESKHPDFTCPHSGESFNLGDECWIVNNYITDTLPCFEVISERDIKGYYERLAYFHSKEKAIEWNNNKFGGKDI